MRKENSNIKSELKKSLTTHEAAKLLGVSPTTVISWLRSLNIKAPRTIGGHRRIPWGVYEMLANSMEGFEDNKAKDITNIEDSLQCPQKENKGEIEEMAKVTNNKNTSKTNKQKPSEPSKDKSSSGKTKPTKKKTKK